MAARKKALKVSYTIWVDNEVREHLHRHTQGYERRNDTLRRLLGMPSANYEPKPRTRRDT